MLVKALRDCCAQTAERRIECRDERDGKEFRVRKGNHNRTVIADEESNRKADDDDVDHISFELTFTDKAYPNRMFVKMIYENDTWRIESIMPYDQKYEER